MGEGERKGGGTDMGVILGSSRIYIEIIITDQFTRSVKYQGVQGVHGVHGVQGVQGIKGIRGVQEVQVKGVLGKDGGNAHHIDK